MKIESEEVLRPTPKVSWVYIAWVWGVLGFVIWTVIQIDIDNGWAANVWHELGRRIMMSQNEWISQKVPYIKQILALNMDIYADMICTYNTMLMAAVIFFYTVIDTKRMGIPHRTIMSYGMGAYTIPMMFMTILLAMPTILFLKSIQFYATTYGLGIYVFVIQILIVIIILRDTSVARYVKVITRKEYDQYKYIVQNKDKCNMDMIWIYQLRHIEHVTVSDELISDKVRVIRSLLWIPFYANKKMRIMEKNLPDGDMYIWYRYYYKNVGSIFQFLSGIEKKTERSEMYLLLYEFARKLQDWYEKYIQIEQDSQENARLCYHMVLSGIMNAVLFSKVDEGESFCNNILNRYMSEELKMVQLQLYLLSQEVFCVSDHGFKYLTQIDELQVLEKYEKIKMDSVPFFAAFWNVWMDIYYLSYEKKIRHFRQAMLSLTDCSATSIAIGQSLIQIEQKRRMFRNGESSSFTIEK